MLLRCTACEVLLNVPDDYTPDTCPVCADKPGIFEDLYAPTLLELMEGGEAVEVNHAM